MGNKLLLADDSITIQKVVGIIFANEDFDLTVVGNGIAAMEKARELIPDIVLVDALMPGKNGYEVCEEIRREPALAHVPLLLMTGAFEPFDEDKARQCGADDFISKPFESQHLIEKVRTLMALGKERAQSKPMPAASVATPIQEEPAASDLWVVTPDVVPAIQTATAPEVAELVPEIAESTGDFFTMAEEEGEGHFATELTTADEVVEVSADEDLWGAFEVEEVSAEEAFAFEEVPATPTETSPAQAEEDFFFVEPEETGVVMAEAEPLAAPQEFVPQWVAVEEEAFSFEEEASSGGFDVTADSGVTATSGVHGNEAAAERLTSAAAPETAGEEFFEFPSFDVPVPPVAEPQFAPEEEFVPAFTVPEAAPPEAPVIEQQFAPEEEYVPVLVPEPTMPLMPEEPPSPARAGVSPAATAGERALSEEQLAALVARISKEIIEKIAWEVVPDLAETIIRSEIRKIREGE